MKTRGAHRSGRAFRPDLTWLEERVVLSVSIDVRYADGAAGFFSVSERRAAMERAADYVGSLLADSLSAIQPSGSNTWSAILINPATGMLQTLPNLVVPANTLIVYVGGRDLIGAEKANGGPGGYNAQGSDAWLDVVESRGQAGALLASPTDTGPWGGSITFDSVGTDWYFGESIDGIQSSQTDFFSVAIHELAHVLGVGIHLVAPEVTPWSRLVSGTTFTGSNAVAAHGGSVPLTAEGSHWAEGTRSEGREAAMDPTLLQGTRKLYTALDLAGLRDLGWTVGTPSAFQFASPEFFVDEDATFAGVAITRPSGGGPASVRLRTQGGTATPGLDYEPVDTVVSFGAGETTKFVPLVILDDTLTEGSETIGLVLSDFVGGVGGTLTSATLTIRDRERGAANDYDGNGVTDLGVFTIASALWGIDLKDASGATLGSREHRYGIPGDFAQQAGLEPLTDLPIPGDYNGDGITDRALFRIATAEYLVQYLDADGGMIASRSYQFGFPGDLAIANGMEPLVDIPIPGDYNGDGVYDLAVFRVPNAEWIIRFKKPGFDFKDNLIAGPAGARVVQHGTPGRIAEQFGIPILADMPVPGDYDGNGVTDFAVYRRTDGDQQGQWLIRLNDAAGNRIGTRVFSAVWDLSDDPVVRDGGGPIQVNLPVPGDYDGNGVTDPAVWHAPTGEWRIVLVDPSGNIINRADDGPSNTRRVPFSTPGGPAAQSFPDVPLPAPISSLIKIGLLPGIPNSRFAEGSSARSFAGMAFSTTSGSRFGAVPAPVPIALGGPAAFQDMPTSPFLRRPEGLRKLWTAT